MRELEEQLKEYKRSSGIEPEESRLRTTLRQAEKAFYEQAEERTLSYFEFLSQQAGYIKKRWWALQFLILTALWWTLYDGRDSFLIQRSMGILSPAFVIMILPELWKNRSSASMEIEGAAYYSLRQIYAARMLSFAAVDGLLLSAFAGLVSCTTAVRAEELLIQFFLPAIVTCGICFGTLCSKWVASEAAAVSLAFLWLAVWVFVVLENKLYEAVSVPIWCVVYISAIWYLVYAVKKVMNGCESSWEATMQ